MSGVARIRDIGHFIKTVIGVVPDSYAAGAVNGSGIDRTGFDSCVLHTAGGAATGSPTSQTLDAKLQHSSDDGSADPYTDLPDAAITQITADSSNAEVDVDLSGAKKFIRVVQTVGFTGGTSPEWPSASDVVLAGVENPA